MVKYVVFDGKEFSYSDTIPTNDQYIKLTSFQYLSLGEPIPFAIPGGKEAEEEVLNMMNFMFKRNATTTIFIVNGKKFLDPAVAEMYSQKLSGKVEEEERVVSIPEMLFGDEVDAVIFSTALGEIMVENGLESHLN